LGGILLRQQGRQTGFIAQEVETVFPNWVDNDPTGYKTMSTRGLEAMVVESLRTLKTENDELRARVRALETNRGVMKSDIGIGVGGWPIAVLLLLGGAYTIVTRRRKGTSA
jgi:hypothetical protein